MSWRNLPKPGAASCSTIAAAVSRSPSSAWISAIALGGRGVRRGRAQGCAQECVELLVLAALPPHGEHLGAVDGAGERVSGSLGLQPSVGGERLAVRETALHDRPQRPELGGVGEQERLVEALGQLGVGVELAVGGGHVAVLEKVGEPPPTGRHGELELVGLERQRPALCGVGEALLEVVRPPLGVAAAVDRHAPGSTGRASAAPSPLLPRSARSGDRRDRTSRGPPTGGPSRRTASPSRPAGRAPIASSRRATSVSSRRPLKW